MDALPLPALANEKPPNKTFDEIFEETLAAKKAERQAKKIAQLELARRQEAEDRATRESCSTTSKSRTSPLAPPPADIQVTHRHTREETAKVEAKEEEALAASRGSGAEAKAEAQRKDQERLFAAYKAKEVAQHANKPHVVNTREAQTLLEVEQQNPSEDVRPYSKDIKLEYKNEPLEFSGLKAAKKRKRPEKDKPPEKSLSVDTADKVATKKRKSPSTNNSPSPVVGNVDASASTTSSVIPKKPPRNNVKARYKNYEVVDMKRRLPEWYETLPATKRTLARGDLDSMKAAKDMIQRCIENKDTDAAEKTFSELRTKIHDMEFYMFLNPDGSTPGLAPHYLKKSKLLEEDGLPKIFSEISSKDFPFDIRADAEALWGRWMIGDFDPNLYRGIDTSTAILEKSGRRRTAHKLTLNYPYRRSANTFGANNLINGQWWPSRLCAMRDGAHSEVEAGICGQQGIGAFAVVVSQGAYQDEDNGTTLHYCGTEGKEGVASRGTLFLQETHRKGQQLRVLRAPKKGSKYAPKAGVRYDGLYTIEDSEILDHANVMFRFTLKRVEGQDPIRYKGEGIRPSPREQFENQQVKKFLQ